MKTFFLGCRDIFPRKTKMPNLPVHASLYPLLQDALKGPLLCSPGDMDDAGRRDLEKIMAIAKLEWGHDISTWRDLQSLATIVLLRKLWVRPLDDFKRSRGDRSSWQLDEALFRHLLLAYDVPSFLDNQLQELLSNHNKKFEESCLTWLLILGLGGSLKKSSDFFSWVLPGNFTQKLFEVPETGLSLEQGVKWALVLAYGGEAEDCPRLMELLSVNDLWHLMGHYRIGDGFKHFWAETVCWVRRNRKKMDDDRWEVIKRWLSHLNSEIQIGRHHFSWKRRTVGSVFRIAQQYERDRVIRSHLGPWRSKGLKWSQNVEGFGDCRVVELTDSQDLSE